MYFKDNMDIYRINILSMSKDLPLKVELRITKFH